MERVNKICEHKLWKQAVEEISQLEEKRVFCRHNTEHFLDVARLAYIENLEKGLGIEKELLYAAALLHDIGRVLEYTEQIPHDKGSVLLAEKILPECGFTKEEEREKFWQRFPATEKPIFCQKILYPGFYIVQIKSPEPVFFAKRRERASGVQKRKILP